MINKDAGLSPAFQLDDKPFTRALPSVQPKKPFVFGGTPGAPASFLKEKKEKAFFR